MEVTLVLEESVVVSEALNSCGAEEQGRQLGGRFYPLNPSLQKIIELYPSIRKM